jgi:hypothetical protein
LTLFRVSRRKKTRNRDMTRGQTWPSAWQKTWLPPWCALSHTSSPTSLRCREGRGLEARGGGRGRDRILSLVTIGELWWNDDGAPHADTHRRYPLSSSSSCAPLPSHTHTHPQRQGARQKRREGGRGGRLSRLKLEGEAATSSKPAISLDLPSDSVILPSCRRKR